LQAGAAGVDMGRNIWQNNHPVAMIKAVRAIVHQRVTVKEANDLFKKMKNEPSDENRLTQKKKIEKITF
jgi:putative autoinducer-2 (AI-2) aldolase